MLFNSCILAALMTLASALPTDSAGDRPFLLMAIAENESFHFKPLVAHAGSLWVGDISTEQICPTEMAGTGQCLPSTIPARSVFSQYSPEAISLRTNGYIDQLLWVSKTGNGALIYNQDDINPEQKFDDYGANIHQQPSRVAKKPAFLLITGGNWLACPDTNSGAPTNVFKVYAGFQDLEGTSGQVGCKTFKIEIWASNEWQL